MQNIGEILEKMKPIIVKGNTESISSLKKIKTWHYEDGSTYFSDVGVLALPGEDLTMALARLRSERIQQLFGNAQVPKRFQDWQFDTFPVGKGKQVAFEAAKQYGQKPTQDSLFILGAYGTGKTGLAISVLKERIAQEVPSLFISVPDLLDKIRSTYSGHGDYTGLMEAVKSIDFLVLDDLGSEYPTAWAKEKLYQLISHRHAWELPLVATSNLTPDELGEKLGERSLWRMIEMGTMVLLEGENLRGGSHPPRRR